MDALQNWYQYLDGTGKLISPGSAKGQTWHRRTEGRRRGSLGNIWTAKVWTNEWPVSEGWWLKIERNCDGRGRVNGGYDAWEFGPFECAELAKAYAEEYLAWRTSPTTWREGVPQPTPVLKAASGALSPTERLALIEQQRAALPQVNDPARQAARLRDFERADQLAARSICAASSFKVTYG